MKGQVLCRTRAGKTLTFQLPEGEGLIGREPGMAVSLALDGVSRRHARIVWETGLYWLEDLGSTNGTFLNGRPVRRERLRHLDVITLGKRVDLIFALRGDEFRPQGQSGIVRAALIAQDEEGQSYEVPPGELTLGRASSCNVAVGESVVSSLHARVQRTAEQLTLEDLGSANGTFVNGARVMSTELHDGDVISLAKVASFKVEIVLGEVLSASGVRARPAGIPAPVASARPRYSGEWKTRFEWSSGEIAALEAERAGIAPKEDQTAMKSGGTRPSPAVRGVAPAVAKPAAPAKDAGAVKPPLAPKAPVEAKPAIKAAAAPAPASAGAPAVAKPGPTVAKPAVPSAPPASKPTPGAAPPAAKTPAAAPPSASPVAKPAPAAKAAEPPVPVASAKPAPVAAGPIRGLRLEAQGIALRIEATGAHALGRAQDVPLRIDNPTVSRRHARVVLADDRGMAYVQDTGGANGTYLNGALIEQLAPLTEGDRIRLGDVELVVRIER